MFNYDIRSTNRCFSYIDFIYSINRYFFANKLFWTVNSLIPYLDNIYFLTQLDLNFEYLFRCGIKQLLSPPQAEFVSDNYASCREK